MILLINRTDIAEYRQISEGVPPTILNPQIEDAQFLDLQPLLGAKFYNFILRDYKSDADLKTLLDGGNYTYQAETYTNVGLKRPLCYYAYARYYKFGGGIDTPFSVVNKLNPDGTSAPVSEGNRQSVFKMNQQAAYTYFMNVKQFLDRNLTLYPLWEADCIKPTRSFRLNKIV